MYRIKKMTRSSIMRLGQSVIQNIDAITKIIKPSSKPKPLGRWMVNDENWTIRAEYATSDSCGGDLCRKSPPKQTQKSGE